MILIMKRIGDLNKGTYAARLLVMLLRCDTFHTWHIDLVLHSLMTSVHGLGANDINTSIPDILSGSFLTLTLLGTG